MQTETQGVVAYILMGYPRISETFIANEIHLLERMGVEIRLFAVKRGDEEKVNAVVDQIRAKPSYTPKVSSLSKTTLAGWLYRNAGKYVPAHTRLIRRQPLRYLRTLGQAFGMSLKYRPSPFAKLKKIYIKEFLQAGFIAAQIVEDDAVRHLHGHFCHGATNITWFVSRMTGIPFSFTAHAKDIYKPTLNPGDLLERKLKAAEFATTCTGANVTHLHDCYPDYEQVHKIYHGLDTDFFAPPSSGRQDSEAPLILSVGRFVKKKGFPNLIIACALLRKAGIRFRCLIVGENGDSYDDELPHVKEMIRELGLEDVVTLQDVITQEELKKLYERATLFALPCQVSGDGDRDGIPNVLVESMAMGIPVVSTPVSGIPELIEDGHNGFLVSPEDSVELAEAMRKLLEDRALHAVLSRAARDKVCREFDSRETNRALRDLFISAMQGMPIPPPSAKPGQTEQAVADV